jgi:hypothetical protein
VAVRLVSGSPFFVGRLGTSEATFLLNYLDICDFRHVSPLARLHARLQGKPDGWNESRVSQLCQNAGFFNPTPEQLEAFAERCLEDMQVFGRCGPLEIRARRKFAS